MTPHHETGGWPFPGPHAGTLPPHDLPPARYAVGDWVRTRWGHAQVIRLFDWPNVSDTRAYLVKHTWSQSPAGYGHIFGEAEMQPAAPPAQDSEVDAAAPAAPQMELFA